LHCLAIETSLWSCCPGAAGYEPDLSLLGSGVCIYVLSALVFLTGQFVVGDRVLLIFGIVKCSSLAVLFAKWTSAFGFKREVLPRAISFCCEENGTLMCHALG
jgi:hypothetical protein